MIRCSFPLEDLTLIEDALDYYRLSTGQGGPDEHSVEDIKRVQGRVTRYLAHHEAREGS